MRISIVIATYNSGKTLRQTLDSIRYQSYKDLEVIVIDGKSVDDTLEIVNEYSDIVSKCISEKDTGVYNAFNKGIDLATGDYICFVGSDDCYCGYDVFKNIAKELLSNKEMYSFPIIIVNSNTLIENFYNNKLTKQEILSGCMIPHPGLITRTDIMRKYRFNEENKIISDYEFLVRYVIDGGGITFCDLPIVYFSEDGISSGEIGTENWITRISEHIVLLEKLKLQKYRKELLYRFLQLDKINSFSYHFRYIRRIIRRKLGVTDNYKKYFKFGKRHRCKLKICRWCNSKDY